MFRDSAKTSVTFRIRPTRDLRSPRDAFRYQRRVEQRKVPAKELPALGAGPLEPEIIPATEAPRDLFDDDKYSSLRDEWYAEEREWMNDFAEDCR